ncbi:MAG: UDP-3-O-acyl-N-acetylglucosamine deacetylase [Planctomycetota bacterium]|jgi:UDP-3-O-acyl N-acetylglucosamine deacetylase
MIDPTRNQRTIASPATVRGIGYWSGRDVRVEFRPAEADTGIVFVRDDLEGRPQIAATIENWTDTALRTTLRCGTAGVDMIEHIMAALAGLQIDNCRLCVDQAEMPGCDGSCLPFVEALSAAGIVEQDAIRPRRIIREIIRLGGAQSWIEARPCCTGDTVLEHELDYGSGGPIGHQSLDISLSPESFCDDLAASRTFVFQKEAAALRAQGLGQRVTYQDLLVFGPDGPIDNQLRFPDECVRHKLLDMVGDLALAGCDLIGRFVAYRSGHRLNAELVRAILDQGEAQQDLKRCA